MGTEAGGRAEIAGPADGLKVHGAGLDRLTKGRRKINFAAGTVAHAPTRAASRLFSTPLRPGNAGRRQGREGACATSATGLCEVILA